MHYHQVKVAAPAARYTVLVQKANVLAKIGASAGADKFKKVMAAMDALKNFLEADVDDIAEVEPGLAAPQQKAAPTSRQEAGVSGILNSMRGKDTRKHLRGTWSTCLEHCRCIKARQRGKC